MNNDKQTEIAAERIACQQILVEDQSVFSVQRLLIPAGVHAGISSAELLRLYLDYVERFTLGIIRVNKTAAGVEFRLARSGLALIGFAEPLFEQGVGWEKTILQIAGGMLVQPKECDRGQLEFRVERSAAGSCLTLQLTDYCPLLLGSSKPSLWRKSLYRFTQAYLHKMVTVRFLRLVYRQLTGRQLASATVELAVRKGERI